MISMVFVTSYTLRKADPAKTRVDVAVVAVAQGPQSGSKEPTLKLLPGAEGIAEAYGRKLTPLLRSMSFTGGLGEVLRVPTGDVIKASQLLVIGMGKNPTPSIGQLRSAAGTAARNLGNAASVVLALPTDTTDALRAVVGGFLAGSYSYTEYKSSEADSKVSEVIVLTDMARDSAASNALEDAQQIDRCLIQARDWVNTPPNDLSPATFADSATAFAKELKGRTKSTPVKTEVFDEEQLAEMGCGGILGVGQGSANPPRLVKLSYAPEGAQSTIALVGKGITFDSGGLTIKPGSSMSDMKMDMAGAATVIAATHAIAALELPVNVITFAPMAENMPSGHAIRPGDVLTMRNGKTVEIANTDAEGRLVLADALSLAVEEEPDLIVDAATLTGACVVALGEQIAGLFGDDEAVALLSEASELSGEALWRLPIPDEKRKDVTQGSRIADILQHKWVRWGSSLYAAAFLEQFTGNVSWAHLDIAGPAYNSGGPRGDVSSGGTGFGLTTLVALAEGFAAAEDDE